MEIVWIDARVCLMSSDAMWTCTMCNTSYYTPLPILQCYFFSLYISLNLKVIGRSRVVSNIHGAHHHHTRHIQHRAAPVFGTGQILITEFSSLPSVKWVISFRCDAFIRSFGRAPHILKRYGLYYLNSHMSFTFYLSPSLLLSLFSSSSVCLYAGLFLVRISSFPVSLIWCDNGKMLWTTIKLTLKCGIGRIAHRTLVQGVKINRIAAQMCAFE